MCLGRACYRPPRTLKQLAKSAQETLRFCVTLPTPIGETKFKGRGAIRCTSPCSTRGWYGQPPEYFSSGLCSTAIFVFLEGYLKVETKIFCTFHEPKLPASGWVCCARNSVAISVLKPRPRKRFCSRAFFKMSSSYPCPHDDLSGVL